MDSVDVNASANTSPFVVIRGQYKSTTGKDIPIKDK